MSTPLSLKSLIKAGGHVSGFLRQASPFHSLVSDAEAKGEKPEIHFDANIDGADRRES